MSMHYNDIRKKTWDIGYNIEDALENKNAVEEEEDEKNEENDSTSIMRDSLPRKLKWLTVDPGNYNSINNKYFI